jgi:hypothetical protein
MLTEDTINSGKKVSISAEFGIQIYLMLWRNASPGNSVPQFGNLVYTEQNRGDDWDELNHQLLITICHEVKCITSAAVG